MTDGLSHEERERGDRHKTQLATTLGVGGGTKPSDSLQMMLHGFLDAPEAGGLLMQVRRRRWAGAGAPRLVPRAPSWG